MEVSRSWKGSIVFTADRLRRYPNNPLPGQASENPAGEDVDGTGAEEWEVDKVTASRLYRGKLQYQAQWRGWDPDPEWYPASDFKNAPAALQRYHDNHPDQTGPPKRLTKWLLATAENRFAAAHPDDDRPVDGTAAPLLRRSQRRKN